MRITNLLLWVQENKLSEKFYKRLGFDITHSDDEHTVATLHGFSLNLVSMRDEELFARDSMSGDKGRGVYVYIHVDGVDAKYEELTADGLVPVGKPRDWPWGNREFILRDPDGYKICFWQAITK